MVNQELPAYIIRMQTEFEELSDRAVNLHKFINSDPYMSLDPIARRLLELQFAAMLQYQFFLEQRLHFAYKGLAETQEAVNPEESN